ncbi:hypothetical protein KIN20_030639 [Parelaphostrongylus tenuis]|uniref:Uncharacterized protein n=1 Tax=Parelaphostrongylus tenuis TaxID=148309 RepID=A0AAD5R4E2_PARTN|nr:hypothetical protein KIN20_030639 [Parelaphostrongylus tenuis]
MVYTRNTGESARVSGIASDRGGARAFVQSYVMQTVNRQVAVGAYGIDEESEIAGTYINH